MLLRRKELSIHSSGMWNTWLLTLQTSMASAACIHSGAAIGRKAR
jgi:hypothetical protein